MMLQIYVKEFLAVCEYLQRKEGCRKGGYLTAPKAEVAELLNRNRYETALRKLKLWKALHWIDTDKKRLTRRVYERSSGKYFECIRIYEEVYRAIKELSVEV